MSSPSNEADPLSLLHLRRLLAVLRDLALGRYHHMNSQLSLGLESELYMCCLDTGLLFLLLLQPESTSKLIINTSSTTTTSTATGTAATITSPLLLRV